MRCSSLLQHPTYMSMPTLSTLYPDHGPWNCFNFTKQNTDQNYMDSCIICVMSDVETLWVRSEYERFDQSNIEYDTNNQLEYVCNYIVHDCALFRMHARCHVRRHVTVRTNMLKRVRLIYRRTSNYWIVSGKKRVSTGALGALDDPLVVQTKIC